MEWKITFPYNGILLIMYYYSVDVCWTNIHTYTHAHTCTHKDTPQSKIQQERNIESPDESFGSWLCFLHTQRCKHAGNHFQALIIFPHIFSLFGTFHTEISFLVYFLCTSLQIQKNILFNDMLKCRTFVFVSKQKCGNKTEQGYKQRQKVNEKHLKILCFWNTYLPISLSDIKCANSFPSFHFS
jgi:hypothetical protein